MKKRHTITVLTENTPGVLHRITSVFTKRKVNIESLTVSETEHEEISRFTVVFYSEPEFVSQLVRPIQKIVEVVDAFASDDETLLYKEIAFLRVGFSSEWERADIEKMATKNNGKVILANGRTMVIEITGEEDEVDRFRDMLKAYPLKTFVRSGRIAIKRELTEELLDHTLDE
ncbi:MAG: acetolactate synthase small subunit [Deltaproteobacteria bacterium]|nr:acetolactate synthase small subunit [Deltaproteobacteria bacterium]